ncbi:LysR family transcriptional regulator [Pandoraea sputorum]|uniref:LysR family transcriptional regulator n=1 Tax=Pandoraea sputorum TaxID=93222 RepID=UPI001787500E|nr:LysR family transcriptional regulator [Pandoraea sputorum]
MDLNGTLAFVTVVECGSFSAAARTLEIPRSTVSARVASLEAHLGVLLLRRTTRRIALTDDGRDYFERAAPAIRTLREAEQFDETDAAGRRPLNGSIRWCAVRFPVRCAESGHRDVPRRASACSLRRAGGRQRERFRR